MKLRLRAIATASILALVGPASGGAWAGEPAAATAQNDLQFMLPLNGFLEHGRSDTLALKALPATPLTLVDGKQAADGPIIIDNDEQAVLETIEPAQWQEIPDAEGKTQINTGARFPVSILNEYTSKTAKCGDPIQARLKVDLKIGGKLIASKGTIVNGHISSAERARAILHSELSAKRWMRANGALGIQFDEIVTESGDHLPLVAAPARQSRIVNNSGEGRVLGINDRGEIVTPLSIQLKHQALHLAIRGAASAGGVFSMGAVPLAYGLVGAINPSFAFLHPVGKNVPHRRLKGFAMGVVSGLPGGFLIADSMIHGQEAVIKPGDEFLAEFKQNFTGEAGTSAELVPGASKKVHGEVVKEKSAK
jgi:hypothetical protein